MKIYGITDLIENENLVSIKKSSFFYIKRTEMVIPWYNIFTYFFYNINNNLYINDTEFKHVLDPFFININLVTNENHLALLQNVGFDKIIVDKAFFITYTHNNAGHIFSEIVYQIYLYKTNKLDEYTLFITKELYDFSPFISSVIYLFFPKNLVNIINEKTLVEFNDSFVFKGSHYKNSNSIDFLVNKLKIETSLIKTHNNINPACKIISKAKVKYVSFFL